MSRRLSRIVIGFLIFFYCVFLTSCAASQSSSATSAPNASPVGGTAPDRNAAQVSTPTATAEALAARVNGQTITLAALDRDVERRIQGIKASGETPPADTSGLRQEMLDAMIQQLLIEQAAAIQGIQVSDADVEAEIRLIIESVGGVEKWRAQLQIDNLTEAEYRAGLRSALITQKMRDIVTRNICVNVEQVRARHILVAEETGALQIRAELDKGADFAALAAQYSLDVTTKDSGGDLGWFTRGQLLQTAVEEAAFGLEKNAISGPVKSELGYHIIQTLDRSTDRPLDPAVCADLSQAAFERWIQDLESKATIERLV